MTDSYQDKLQAVAEINIGVIRRAQEDIAKNCEQYPDIKRFVDLVLDFRAEVQSCSVPSSLRTLVWEISGMSISDNPYHASSTLTSLASFIGNYFLDDAYFQVRQDQYGCWVGLVGDDDNSSQDPLELITAAEKNAQHYKEIESRYK